MKLVFSTVDTIQSWTRLQQSPVGSGDSVGSITDVPGLSPSSAFHGRCPEATDALHYSHHLSISQIELTIWQDAILLRNLQGIYVTGRLILINPQMFIRQYLTPAVAGGSSQCARMARFTPMSYYQPRWQLSLGLPIQDCSISLQTLSQMLLQSYAWHTQCFYRVYSLSV
ncbi:hypothetical protein BDV11DRAFT_179138 [Aspergillus similis]